ncbi:MAG: ATP-binding protein [Ignavibacteriae bacterium]|nr:ATP-binding protein [Ignavibacteriota bacterium]
MRYKDIDNLVEEGEGFEVEFKRKVSSPIKIAKALTAFANTKGGKILFGVDDDGSIVGVESEKTEVEMIETAGSFYCDPPVVPRIEIVPYKGKDVIVVDVSESSQKPHHVVESSNGNGEEETRVFIRVKDKTVLASKEVVRILEAESPDAPPLRISIGEPERRLLDYLGEKERITVKEFGDLVNISNRRASRILIQLVRAGVLRIHTHEKQDYFTLAFDV